MVAHSYNSSTGEAKAEGLGIWDQFGLHSEYRASLNIHSKTLFQKHIKKRENFGQVPWNSLFESLYTYVCSFYDSSPRIR